MEAAAHDGLALLKVFATSLGVGLLIGLERERNPAAKAGLRTFGLTALLGSVAGLLAQRAGAIWLLPVGLFVVGAMTVAAYLHDHEESADPGTTTVVAIMLSYILGAMVWYGYSFAAVPLAIAVTSLLYFKAELRGFSERLTRKDLVSILQFGVLSFIVLPLLPDRSMGPYAAFNPHQIWLMVVLISGLSLAGYVALRVVGQRYGAALVGFFGGLVSSTATTLLYSRQARDNDRFVPLAAVVVSLASLMVLVRLAVLSAVSAPGLIPTLLPVLAGGFVAGLGITAYHWRGGAEQGQAPLPQVRNPTELRTSLSFGALYALVLFLSTWLSDSVGSEGIYALAIVSGLTDVDAITLSSLRLFTLQKLSALEAVSAITLAALANLALKFTLIFAIGGRQLGTKCAPPMAAIAIGMFAAFAVLRAG